MNTVSTLYLLGRSENHTKLDFSPNDIDFISIILVVCLFVTRSLLYAVGLGTPFLSTESSHESGRMPTETFTLPDISLSMPFKLDLTDQRTFADSIGIKDAELLDLNTNNAQLCLYLAALSEPAMLLLLAKRGCPVRPLGAVNVRNRFEILDVRLCRILLQDPSALSQRLNQEGRSMQPSVSVVAKFVRSARRVRRGLEIDVEVSIMVHQPSQDVKYHEDFPRNQYVVIFRQEFTILQFLRSSKQSKVLHIKEAEQSTQGPNVSMGTGDKDVLIQVPMSSQAPYLWAKLCKDYNPIHLSPVTAKILGQAGQLAHGNHAVSICIRAMSDVAHERPNASFSPEADHREKDALQKLIVDTMEDKSVGAKAWWMEVRFRRPVVLPSTFSPSLYTGGVGFDIVDNKTKKVNIEVNVGTM